MARLRTRGSGMVRLGRRLGSRASRPLQRGRRTVLWTPNEGLGFGNVLYLWLHAYLRQRHGEQYRVLTPHAMHVWLEELPRVREALAVDRAQVRVSDRRDHGWFSRFGSDFSRAQLHGFVGDCLVGTSLVPGPSPDPTSVTVNVRRGDYYATPHFRGTYGFDIAAYVDLALAKAATGCRIDRILVVSDGLDWCRLKLDRVLREHAEVVDYVADTDTPQDNFRVVATSQRLIGTNSTFSYWGGYVGNVLYGVDSHVVMPRFHARLDGDYSAYQLDPAWCVVEDIPGGWDA